MSRHPELGNIRFSKWLPFDHLFENRSLYCKPGVYFIAYFNGAPSRFKQSEKNILYIGMSNRSVYTRLKHTPQIVTNTNLKRGFRLAANRPLLSEVKKSKLYFATYLPDCDFPPLAENLSPKQIRELGKIQYLEKNAFARFVKAHGRLPPLNVNIRG